MSQHGTTIALMANRYAIKHLQREMRLERVLATFSRKHRRILAVLQEQESILQERESQLGEGARKRRAA